MRVRCGRGRFALTARQSELPRRLLPFARVADRPRTELAAASFDATRPPFKASIEQSGIRFKRRLAIVTQGLTGKMRLAYHIGK
jgi:hypothetical protein